MPLEALIFDVDGTLAETEELHRRAFNETFRAFGLDWVWPRDVYRELLRVAGGRERIIYHIDHLGALAASAGAARQVRAEMHADKTARYEKLDPAPGWPRAARLAVSGRPVRGA